MKKIFTFIILICICFITNMVEAKLTYEFDWELGERAFFYRDKDDYYFINFDGSVDEEFIFKYDKNGNLISQDDFIDEDFDIEAFIKTKEFDAYSNFLDDVYKAYYVDRFKNFCFVNYSNEFFDCYDSELEQNVTIYFKDDLDLVKKALKEKYDIYLKLKNEGYLVGNIIKSDDYYIASYYTYDQTNGFFNDYIGFYDNSLKEMFNHDFGEIYFDASYIYIYDGLIYFFFDNLTIDVYKLDGTKYDTIYLEHDVIKKESGCNNFGLYRVLIENNEMFLHYKFDGCPSRISVNDASEIENIAKIDSYDAVVLKYSINYEVEKVNSSNGDFTYENKVDEDGKSYVELKIEPKDGYSVKEIIVTDLNGNKIEVIDNKFYMPLNDVKVEVKYIEGEYLPIPNTSLSQNLSFILIGIILIGLGSYTMKFVKREEN